MKNMKKLVALFAAVVMTLSFGVSAFAAVGVTNDGESIADGTFNLVFTGSNGANQMTMIAYLVPAAEYTADDGANPIPPYSSQEVVAIDQVGGSAGFGTVPVDVAKLTDGNAIAVVIGGTDVAPPAKYLVTYNAEEETITVLIGDVDGDGYINMSDAAAVLNHFTKDKLITDERAKVAADVDGDTYINMSDAAAILNHFTKDKLIVQPK